MGIIYYNNLPYSGGGGGTGGNGLAPIRIPYSDYYNLPITERQDPSKLYLVETYIGGDVGLFPTTWYGARLNILEGGRIWNDGINIYCSDTKDGDSTYKLNDIAWEYIHWEGPCNHIYGNSIWRDGVNTYYSEGGRANNQYKLNSNIWEPMPWEGFNNLEAKYVWNDGFNIYYSSLANNQYKLNGITWEPMTWEGFNNFRGNSIWNDGINTYYSYENNQYKLNGITWEPITWNGAWNNTNFKPSGGSILIHKNNIYHFNSYYGPYILNNTTWEKCIISTCDPNSRRQFERSYFWIDNDNVYYSYDNCHYKFYPTSIINTIYYMDNAFSMY